MKNLTATLIALLCFGQVLSQGTDPVTLRGTVLDTRGLPVAGAFVEITSGSGDVSSCPTNDRGIFTCETEADGSFSISVRADGFTILRQTFANIQEFGRDRVFALEPGAVRADVTVTVGRIETRLAETPASVAVLTREDLAATAAPATDDALRQTVGFSLFRRSGSRTANPTSQGTSLRGTNASGGSRALVLFDGVPVNDAFGGWIYWSRVPAPAVERIEVVRGGSSSLYGSDALGGTIGIVGRKVSGDEGPIVSAEIWGGTQRTFSAFSFLGYGRRGWSADLALGTFQTRGYRTVDAAERGAVDDFGNSRNTNLSLRAGRDFGNGTEVFARIVHFGEARNNGTPVQKNRTHFRQYAVGGDLDLAAAGLRDSTLALRAYGGTQVFDQTFSAVAAGRDSENLVRLQRVPSQNLGLSGQLATVFGRHTVAAGAEFREVRGASDEIGFFGGRAVSRLGAGGRERTYGLFVQDLVRVGDRLVLAGSLRFDRWRNFRALRSLTRLADGRTTTEAFADRSETAFSPGGSALFQATGETALYLNVSRSFRAPTLNELYRGFRVGDIVTDPNEDLRAERAFNLEGGISYGRRAVYFRAAFFVTRISDAVSNVTVSVTPSLIRRQRRNAGRTRAAGLEAEAEARLGRVRLTAGYLLTDAVVTNFPSDPALEGLRVPQVPRHQFTFQTRFDAPSGWDLAAQGRFSAGQFEDDLNRLRLGPFFQLDLYGAKRLAEGWRFFAAVENVLNSRYAIGRTPVRTVAPPVGLRLGLRWN